MSSSAAEIAGKKVTLRSSDGEVYVVEEVEVLESKTIKDVLEDGSPDDVITLPNVTGEILSKIIEYCKKHVNAASALANYEVSVNDDDRKFLEKIIEYGNNNIISESLLKIIQDCEEHVKATSVKDDDRKFLWKIIEYDKKHRTGLLLWQIIKDWEKHVNFPSTIADDLKAFDANLVEVDRDTLYALILAANYLNIKSLLDLTCEVVADMIKGKTPLEIREFFGIKELTPEEEEEVRRENQWAFE